MAEIEMLRARCEALQLAYESAESHCADARRERDALLAEAENLARNMERLVEANQALAAERHALRAEVERLGERIGSLRLAYEMAEGWAGKNGRERDGLLREAATLKAENVALRAENDTLRAELSFAARTFEKIREAVR